MLGELSEFTALAFLSIIVFFFFSAPSSYDTAVLGGTVKVEKWGEGGRKDKRDVPRTFFIFSRPNMKTSINAS